MSESYQSGQIIKAEPRANMPQVDLRLESLPEWTSLDFKMEQSKALYMKAKGDTDYDGEWLLLNPINVENVLIHVWQREDPETGEVTYPPRMVLIQPDGTMAATTAIGALESMRDLCKPHLYGDLPWIGGRKLQLIRKKTSGKRFTHKFVIAGHDLEGGDTNAKQPTRHKAKE